MSRPKRHQKNEQEEDAGQLKLGTEFDDTHTLNTGEVRFLLERRSETGTKPQNEVFKKTFDYVSSFAKYTDFNELERVNEIFQRDPTFRNFERAQLANLTPSDVDEAKALIPSLSARDEDTLQALLTELESVRQMA